MKRQCQWDSVVSQSHSLSSDRNPSNDVFRWRGNGPSNKDPLFISHPVSFCKKMQRTNATGCETVQAPGEIACALDDMGRFSISHLRVREVSIPVESQDVGIALFIYICRAKRVHQRVAYGSVSRMSK